MFTSEYTAPILTVDSVVFELQDNHLCVLLIQRSQESFTGWWALPGGYCAAGETTTEAMGRIMTAKVGLDTARLRYVEQLYTFDTVARDPRGHAVSVTYMGLGRDIETHIGDASVGNNIQNPGFFPVDELPNLAFDHGAIISYAHERLRSKLAYTNAIFALLPELFTLTQLQSAYEAVLGRDLDKRNFRKKFLSLDLIQKTDQQLKDGAHRPARLYRFNQQSLQTIDRSFD